MEEGPGLVLPGGAVACTVCTYSNSLKFKGFVSDDVILDLCPYCKGVLQYLSLITEDRIGHPAINYVKGHFYLHIYGSVDQCYMVRKILQGAKL